MAKTQRRPSTATSQAANEARARDQFLSGLATARDLEGIDATTVRGWLAMDRSIEERPTLYRQKAMPMVGHNPERRSVRFVWSTEHTDRSGDIVRVRGIETDEYERNNVALWAHGYGVDAEILGSGVNLKVEKLEDGVLALTGDIEFAAAEQSEFADKQYRLATTHTLPNGEVIGPFLRATSVGFKPLETRYIEDEDERKKLGLGRWGVIYERSKLWEISLCAIPCNQNAVRAQIGALVQMGVLDEGDEFEHLGFEPLTERDWKGVLGRQRERQRREPVHLGRRTTNKDGELALDIAALDDRLKSILEGQQRTEAAVDQILEEIAEVRTLLPEGKSTGSEHVEVSGAPAARKTPPTTSDSPVAGGEKLADLGLQLSMLRAQIAASSPPR